MNVFGQSYAGHLSGRSSESRLSLDEGGANMGGIPWLDGSHACQSNWCGFWLGWLRGPKCRACQSNSPVSWKNLSLSWTRLGLSWTWLLFPGSARTVNQNGADSGRWLQEAKCRTCQSNSPVSWKNLSLSWTRLSLSWTWLLFPGNARTVNQNGADSGVVPRRKMRDLSIMPPRLELGNPRNSQGVLVEGPKCEKMEFRYEQGIARKLSMR